MLFALVIGCRGKFPQKTLIRFVCQGDKTLQMDGTKKLGGRGAYVCRSESCIHKAFKVPKRINVSLRAQLTSSVITQLEQTLLEGARTSTNSTEKKEELS